MNTDGYKGHVVVIDTDSDWIYLGTLSHISDGMFVVLNDVDAFATQETTLTRHEYLIKVKHDGLVPNRRSVRVRKERIVAISLLDDIITE